MSQNKRAEISSKKQLVLIILGYIFFGCFVFPLIKQSGGWMIEALNLFPSFLLMPFSALI